LLALVPLVLAGRVAVIENRYWLSQLPYEVLPASTALRAAAPEGGTVLARKPHIAYHAGLGYVPMPLVTTLRELADYCHAHQVDFLYYSWLEARARPELCWLVDTTAVVPGLTRVAFIERHPAVVYRIGPELGAEPAWLADRTLSTLHMARGQALVYQDQIWEANLTLGAWALREGKPGEALDYLARVRRRRPDLGRGYVLTGEAHLALSHFDSAAAAFQTAIGLEPAEPRARIGLGKAQLALGRPEAAAASWRPVLGQIGDPTLLQRIAVVYDSLGQAAAAGVARAAADSLARATQPAAANPKR
ncbi:MAG TPA: tetratricopeptide repeat protein, partial [Candidatus Udaeobacter sp.]|nr:tetratricopeptide repeat protein [Candidatus Udaeobacter sp.]